jgi:NitT/TauT family transport system substrate-binding protein
MTIRAFVCGLAALLLATAVHAEEVRIAGVKTTAAGALYIATERGYFADVGIELKFIDFDSPGPVPVAVVSGSADIGSTGVSAELYALAGQGALKLIAGQAHEAKGYQVNAFLVSNAAAAAGLTRFDQLAGHTVAISQVGSPVHYAASQVALKNGVALDRLRFLPLQSNANIVSAVTGGTADTGVVPANVAAPALARGDVKLLGYVGDQIQWQSSAVFITPATGDKRGDMVKRFLTALRRGLRDFHAAFSAPDGTRRDGPTAPAILAILEKYTGLSEAQIRTGIPYVDPEARLDLASIAHELAWFTSQKMLKGPITVDDVIDRRFAVGYPEN